MHSENFLDSGLLWWATVLKKLKYLFSNTLDISCWNGLNLASQIWKMVYAFLLIDPAQNKRLRFSLEYQWSWANMIEAEVATLNKFIQARWVLKHSYLDTKISIFTQIIQSVLNCWYRSRKESSLLHKWRRSLKLNSTRKETRKAIYTIQVAFHFLACTADTFVLSVAKCVQKT